MTKTFQEFKLLEKFRGFLGRQYRGGFVQYQQFCFSEKGLENLNFLPGSDGKIPNTLPGINGEIIFLNNFIGIGQHLF